VLREARRVYFQTAIFLTAEAHVADRGILVSPKGLEIAITNSLTRKEPAVAVTLLRAVDGSPRVRVNNRDAALDGLPSALSESLDAEKTGKKEAILVNADRRIRFSEVIQLIDTCRSTPAKIVLLIPDL
jgi:biopolymer transport protein ExbD